MGGSHDFFNGGVARRHFGHASLTQTSHAFSRGLGRYFACTGLLQ
jgi:hypothetical protein